MSSGKGEVRSAGRGKCRKRRPVYDVYVDADGRPTGAGGLAAVDSWAGCNRRQKFFQAQLAVADPCEDCNRWRVFSKKKKCRKSVAFTPHDSSDSSKYSNSAIQKIKKTIFFAFALFLMDDT